MYVRRAVYDHSTHSLLALCSLGLAIAACREKTVTGVDRVATVEVSPATTTVVVGGSMTLKASVKDQLGDSLTAPFVHWSSSDTSVATVSTEGVVRARKPGEVTIAATSQGVSDVAMVRVSSSTSTPPPPPTAPAPVVVARIEIVPAFATVRSSGKPELRRTQLVAFAYDAKGNLVRNRHFVWASDNTSTATISSSGLVTGQRAGASRITVSTDGIVGSASIVVVK